MLSEKPWKTDAMLRLGVGVLVLVFMGGFVSLIIRFFEERPPVNAALFLGCSAAGLALLTGALVILSRTWDRDNLLLRLIVLLFCVYGGLGLLFWAGKLTGASAEGSGISMLRIIVAIASLQGGIVLLAHRFVREHGVGWVEAFGLNRNLRQALVLGAIIPFLFMPVGMGLQQVTTRILEQRNIEPKKQETVRVLEEAKGWGERLVLAFFAIALAPVAEELLFRGVLYTGIKHKGYPRLALWCSALVFAFMHLNLVSFLPLTLLAMALAWLYEKTGNLLAPIIAHSLFNTINLVLLELQKSSAAAPST